MIFGIVQLAAQDPSERLPRRRGRPRARAIPNDLPPTLGQPPKIGDPLRGPKPHSGPQKDPPKTAQGDQIRATLIGRVRRENDQQLAA